VDGVDHDVADRVPVRVLVTVDRHRDVGDVGATDSPRCTEKTAAGLGVDVIDYGARGWSSLNHSCTRVAPGGCGMLARSSVLVVVVVMAMGSFFLSEPRRRPLCCANLVRGSICAGQMAPPAGLEPATYRLEGGCSVR
jgi:hypothetical protein